ncbi:MAG: PAS domain-containing protein [Opitutaceae bacterium]|nr:PAS domain-containing protein [Opitutaceae bacterium]
MPRSAPSPARRAAAAPAIAALPDPAVITHGRWENGGVEIIFANDAFCRLTGYAAAELAGRNTRLLHGPKTDLTLLRLGRRSGLEGREGQGEGWLSRKDGTPFYARWHFRPLGRDPGGRLVAVYHDWSEVNHLREALLQSQKLDTVGLLAGGMAHDFNNLLSVINGYCEIMSPKIAGVPAAQKDLQEIHRAGLKASEIARQILEFSRRQETEVKVVNFNTLIREIADIIRRVAGDEVAVELRLASDLGNAVIDPTQFQQTLLNLCFNARDAMPQGGKLTIRTYNHRVAPGTPKRVAGMPEGYYAVMQVADNGHGIPAPVLENIFEPFFTTKPHGTGLGLPTVRDIIRQNGGHITVQSTPGKGTTFEVFLPETAEPEQTSVTKLGTLPAMRGTETVLLLEEDAVLRKMIAGILATDGYKVLEAATVEAAEKVSAGIRPHLVLMHANTRAIAELVGRLRTTVPHLRVIGTAAESPAKVLPDFPAKALIHLPKPFALSTLLLKARALLDAGAR